MVQIKEEVLTGEDALVATADFLYQSIRSEAQLKRFFVRDNLVDLAKGLRTFLKEAFNGEDWPKVQMSPRLLDEDAIKGLVDVLMITVRKPQPLGEDALVKAVHELKNKELRSDPRVEVIYSSLQLAAVPEPPPEPERVHEEVTKKKVKVKGAGTGLDEDEANEAGGSLGLDLLSEDGDEEEEEEEEGAGEAAFVASSDGNDVNTKSLDLLNLPDDQIDQAQIGWKTFMDSFANRELAGEALYQALYESTTTLQSLFKSPKAVASMRILNGIHQIIMALSDPAEARHLVEALGFQHLDLEVTVPRVVIFRDAIMDLIVSEVGDKVSPKAQDGLKRTLNYAGGGYIFIRETFSERLKIIATSWRIASGQEAEEEKEEETLALAEKEEAEMEGEEDEEELDGGHMNSGDRFSGEMMEIEHHDQMDTTHVPQQSQRSCLDCLLGRRASDEDDRTMSVQAEEGKSSGRKQQQGVPTTFDEMFQFNAAVMGLSGNMWMYEVLSSFDPIVKNIANSYRVQEEADVLALRIAKLKGAVKPAEYKAVMLASLRSLLPKDWDPAHEVAWNWLWENVERMLVAELGNPGARERALGRFLGSLEDDSKTELWQDVYTKFFALAPGGQDYFKQSATRLYFIADKVFEMTLEMYKDPKSMVDNISALGLRHVGYGIPTELFGPFVTGCIQVVKGVTEDDVIADAFGWSLGLISRVLVRTINEGSTIVMKAINTNSAKQVKKALSCAPRGKRAMWTLNVTVGTQSISPLIWSITSGSLSAATVIITDLLTIRADRDRYYYGVDELFERHPDIVQIMTEGARVLLPTMLDRMLWRSRVATNGMRRVNYYLKHLLVDAEGRFADALPQISKMEDPSIVTHALLVNLADMIWTKFVYSTFLLSKIWLLFTLIVFLFSQSILKTMSRNSDSVEVRYTMFACRMSVYCFSMFELIYSRTQYAYKALQAGEIVVIGQIPFPKRYVQEFHEPICLLLTLMLITMFFMEPFLYCIGEGITDSCPAALSVQDAYAIASMLTMVLYFVLLIDFSALSTRLSAFVLVMGHVLPELGLALLAIGYTILTFGSSIASGDERSADFAGLHHSILSLFDIATAQYSGKRFDELRHYSWTLCTVIAFVLTITVFIFNLLIAQLNTAYLHVYHSMVGYARIRRIDIVCQTIPTIAARRFTQFVDNLNLEQKLEFGEGDIGLAGGIQVLELASAHPTNQDTIKRYGGSTSTSMQWPEEDDDLFSNSEADRLERLEKSIQKAMKKLQSIPSERGTKSSVASDAGEEEEDDDE